MQDPADSPVLAYDDGTSHELQSVVLGFVLLKGVGLLLVVWSVVILVFQFGFMVFGGMRYGLNSLENLIQMLAPIALNTGLGLTLLAGARPMARRLFRLPGGVMPMPVGDGLVALIAVGVGLFLIATSVGDFVRYGFALLNDIRENGGHLGSHTPLAEWIGFAVRVAAGLFLFMRPNWVVGQWRARSRMP